MNQIVIKTYNFDAKHEMRPYQVHLHAQGVQEGEPKRKAGVFLWMA